MTPPPCEPVTEELLARITAILVREANPRRIVLFGSRARGKARPDSDIDLLIVEDEPFGLSRSRVKEFGRLSDALFGILVPVDLVIVSEEEYQAWRDSRLHVVAEAHREGLVLHERAA